MSGKKSESRSGNRLGKMFADLFGKRQILRQNLPRNLQQDQPKNYDAENWKPVLRCSICNGEQVAGFKNIRTGEFQEECFIRDDSQLQAFKRKYGITELGKEY